MDNNVAILATMAALSAAVIIQSLHNLSPVIWKPVDIEVGSLCADVDRNTGCALARVTLALPREP